MTGTFAWNFEPQGDEIRVKVDIDYQLAGGPVGKAVDGLMLHRVNEKTIEDMVQNLGRIATGQRATVS